MKYTKLPISIPEQITLLKGRGLTFQDEERAAHYLSNISYYRLRAYTYPFQDNTTQNHPFIKEISFDDILSLYVFDRQLRLQLFNALEKIEIALRTQIIHEFSIEFGPFWHLDARLYNNYLRFAEDIDSLTKIINRSKETFIKHYKEKYTDPPVPPAWMALEVTSMGLLSKIFSNLRSDNPCKDRIANHFGLKDVDTLANWMRCFSLIRNICAHHSRVWNRRMTKLALPKKPLYPFIKNTNIYPYKVYAYICCMQYILNIISPHHSFRDKIVALMKDCPLLQEQEMGFPKDWQKEKIWQKV